MTEKRFCVVVYDDKAINGFAVLDLQKPNSRLRLGYENVYIGSKEGCEIVCRFGNSLADENEQLKQYIYDNIDEDICNVCSYQYLEKSQIDKYYVAKCKKGYDNCSKGTVIHCKDFKFKELE